MELMIAIASFIFGTLTTLFFLRVVFPFVTKWFPILKAKNKHNPYSKYPKYARLVNKDNPDAGGSEMRLRKDGIYGGYEYWRDGGHWGLKANWEYKGIWPFRTSIIRGVTYDRDELEHLKGCYFVKVSKEEWKEGNKGYV